MDQMGFAISTAAGCQSKHTVNNICFDETAGLEILKQLRKAFFLNIRNGDLQMVGAYGRKWAPSPAINGGYNPYK